MIAETGIASGDRGVHGKKPSRFERAPSTELQNTVTPDSIEVMCIFQVGQWPAQ